MCSEQVRVGLYLTGQFDRQEPIADAISGQLEMLRVARDAGWDSVWTGQHFLPAGVKELQPVPWLSRLIPESGSMRLGFGIHLLSIQNPVATAEDVASLHALSGGRVIYGAALGYRDEEFRALGVDRKQAPLRLERNLEIVRRLLGGETVSSDLPWCRVEEASLPIMQDLPPVPVWVGANADGGVRRAARLADAWLINPHSRIETAAQQLAMFRRARQEHQGSQPDEIPIMREVVCASTRTAALEIAWEFLREKYERYLEWGQHEAMPSSDSISLEFDRLVDGRFIIGDPDDCLAQLLEYRQKLGVDHFVLRTHWPGLPPHLSIESLQLLADGVISRLRGPMSGD